MNEILADNMRLAMRRMAATVTVIAICYNGRRYGTTVSSVTSVSLDPPSLLMCINQRAESHDVLPLGQLFSVNILHSKQDDISKCFSSSQIKGEERFTSLRPEQWSKTIDNVPILQDANAVIICKVDKIIAYGSHSILISKVIDVHLSDQLRPTLLYFQSGYIGLEQ